jgi:hypothetical protein
MLLVFCTVSAPLSDATFIEYASEGEYCSEGNEWRHTEIIGDIHEHPNLLTDENNDKDPGQFRLADAAARIVIRPFA